MGKELYRHITPAELKGKETTALRRQIAAGMKRLPILNRGTELNLPVRNSTMGSALAFLNRLQARAKVMLRPGSPAYVNATSFIETALNQLENKDALEKKHEMMAAAARGDKSAKLMLAAAVTRTTGALMMPSANWMPLLETVTLGAPDQFLLESSIPTEVGFQQIGPDGRAQEVPAHNHFSFDHILLSFLSSDEYVFPLFDPVHGDVRDASLAVIDMARDLSYKLDFMVRAFHLVGATDSRCVATFDLTNADLSKRDYVPHSYVDTSNFPTGNIITLTSNDGTSGPRLDVLRAVEAYVSQWGAGAFPDGDLAPQSIRVPSKDAARFLDEADADSRADTYAGEVKDGPMSLNFGGRRYTVIADNTITGNYAYVQMNKPTGIFVEKPAGNRSFSDDTYEAQKQNVGRVSEQVLVGQAYPRHWKPNFLAVRYRT